MAIAYELFLPVAQAMRETGKTITEPVRLSGNFGATQKSDKSIVTVADMKAQIFLTDFLTRLCPGSQVLGEESFDTKRWQDSPLLKDMGDVFILDPIDGTAPFARGETYGIMNAHKRNGRIQAAWIYYPFSDDMLFASEQDKTHHVTWNAQAQPTARVLPSIPELPLREIVLNTYSDQFPPGELGKFSDVAASFKATRRSECGATEVRTIILTGKAVQFSYNNMKPWDRIPIVYLAERAGAPLAVDFKGDPVVDSSMSTLIAPTRAAQKAILAVTQRIEA